MQLDENSKKAFNKWIKEAFNADTPDKIPKGSFANCMVNLNAKIKYLEDLNKRVA